MHITSACVFSSSTDNAEIVQTRKNELEGGKKEYYVHYKGRKYAPYL